MTGGGSGIGRAACERFAAVGGKVVVVNRSEMSGNSLDLCYGRDVYARMYEYLTDNGMTRDEYNFFMRSGMDHKPHCIMGNDYYWTNEHLVPKGEAYKRLVSQWRDILPMESICLMNMNHESTQYEVNAQSLE